MITKVVLAKLSPTMEEGTIVKWSRQEGDAVKVGDVLAEIETDKANMEMEALGAGVLRKILVPAGGKAPVGALIGVIADAGEDVSTVIAGAASPSASPAPAPAAKVAPAAPTAAAPVPKAPVVSSPPPPPPRPRRRRWPPPRRRRRPPSPRLPSYRRPPAPLPSSPSRPGASRRARSRGPSPAGRTSPSGPFGGRVRAG